MCRLMGSQGTEETKKRDAQGNRIIGAESVGHAKLGLWNAEELLSEWGCL